MNMTDEERQALGEYFAARVRGILEEKEAAENVLNVLGKPILETKNPEYDIMQIVTRQTEGPNGPYLKASPEDNKENPNYDELIRDLQKHDGKLTRQGYFLWLFNDNQSIGMKKSKK